MAPYNLEVEKREAGEYTERLVLDEHYMYGSDRLGSRISSQQNLAYGSFERGAIRRDGTFERRKYKLRSDAVPLTELTAEGTPVLFPSAGLIGKRKNMYLGHKRYELKNHLGNVMATITDRKQSVHIQAVPLVIGDFTRVLSHYQPEVVSISDYYPFGSGLPNRQFSSNEYRYGFGGYEKDDEVSGNGNSYTSTYRHYDPRIGRFKSRDPKAGQFPWWTPYQYAGNRPIDGIDLEGAEYITYLVNVYDNGSGATIIDKVDYRGVKNFNYEKYSESFGPEGRGVKFIYQFLNDVGQVYKTETKWDVRQEGGGFSKSSLGRHGMYQGEGAKTMVGGNLFPVKGTVNSYDWGIAPIDGVDAIAQTHDLDQEGIGTYDWLEDNRTLPGDIAAINAWDNYVSEHDGTAAIDSYTGRKASSEALTAAKTASSFFGMMTRYKQWKIGEMQSRKLDPNNVNHMKQVTIDDYKGKWYQIKRNVEQRILKSASNAPK